jgi:iodotyrosine deiodinase
MIPENTVPYQPYQVPQAEGLESLQEGYQVAQQRRSVRMFSPDPVPQEMIELAIRIAGTAPSGAHRQPWHFVAIQNQALKALIREKVEHEERDFYHRRATPEWLDALAPIGTDFVKEHITTAPWLIVVFRRDYEELSDGSRQKCYYMTESVGIAVGFLLQALHRAGLATLTHTPAPMTILRELCGRPLNEKPFVLIPVGYPAADCHVPNLKRKTLDQISQFIE